MLYVKYVWIIITFVLGCLICCYMYIRNEINEYNAGDLATAIA